MKFVLICQAMSCDISFLKNHFFRNFISIFYIRSWTLEMCSYLVLVPDISFLKIISQNHFSKSFLKIFAKTLLKIFSKETRKKTLARPRIEPWTTTWEATTLPITPQQFDINWRRISLFEFYERGTLGWGQLAWLESPPITWYTS